MDSDSARLSSVLTINAQRLAAYLEAELKILRGQSTRFGDRQLTRADLAEVRREIERLQVLCARERLGSRAGFKQANFGGRSFDGC